MKKYWYIFVGIFVCLISFILIFYSGFYDSKEEKLIKSCEEELGFKLELLTGYSEQVNDDFRINEDEKRIEQSITIKYNVKDITDNQKYTILHLILDLADLKYEQNKDVFKKEYPNYTYVVTITVFDGSYHANILPFDYYGRENSMLTFVSNEPMEVGDDMEEINISDYDVTFYWVDNPKTK